MISCWHETSTETASPYIHCWNKGWLVVFWCFVVFFFFCIWKTEVKLCYTALQRSRVKNIRQKASAVRNGCFTRWSCEEIEASGQHTNLCPHSSCYAFPVTAHGQNISDCYTEEAAGRWKGICAALHHQSLCPPPVFLFLHQNLLRILNECHSYKPPHLRDQQSSGGQEIFPCLISLLSAKTHMHSLTAVCQSCFLFVNTA